MKASLVYTRPDTSKFDPFNGTFFKRWQERVFFAIDVVNLEHILTNPKPKNGSHMLQTWETGNKQVRHAILSIISNELFDIYGKFKVAKEIWDAINKKIYFGRCGNSEICHREF